MTNDALARLRAATSRVVGSSQTAKAVVRGLATEVFVAEDADRRVVEPVIRAAAERGVPITEVDSMAALGRACGIAVGAAAAAVLAGDWRAS
ncbi:MAG: ribosomal L7Ae/L30e/S12e/Gadd45 family protein [Armatimonadota bacterium]|nr:ribosomal L7Ae/L30e/S12e/Gadd45 family protein [Armatimonadota bacterium]MDR7534719.1 ribosomal L7Ae/L30e/S12e/Gadd45 family protein [Armatimonadota bacterium]MDR7537619.1 ribosomal L7Ae/L30e/S12e/Gadd45 family protein [Armatimonadota bacterium]